MSNEVPTRTYHECSERTKSKLDLIFVLVGTSLFALPAIIVYFNSNKKPLEYVVKFIVFIFVLCIAIAFFKHMKARVSKMFERLMMSADEKEFAKITRDLSREKYVVLKTYFKATGTSVESANKFLSSCRGVAFLDAYTKEKVIDNVAISKLILDVEREEQIVACAVDILKSY